MPSEAPLISLADVAASVPNAVAAGPFGSNLVSRDYVESGVPVIRGQNLSGRWVGGDFVYVTPEKTERLRSNTAKPGDVVFTQRGTLGQVSLVPGKPFDRYVISQSQMKLTVDPEKADSRYVYYACTAPQFIRQVHDNAVAAGVPHINLGILRALRIPLPSIGRQREIADVLWALDDKIALLRETNTTLEAIAQALFKSWFVDFDPVWAKAEGREPEGVPSEVADLFPSEFEESELGPIPKGWWVGVFGEIAKLAKGSVSPMNRPDEMFEHYSLPAFDFAQLPICELGQAIKSNKTRAVQDVVLQSKLNPHIPRVWLPYKVGDNAVCSTEFLPWMALAPASKEFIYCLLTSSAFSTNVLTLVTGTSNSHQRVRPEQVANLPTVRPPASIMSTFEDMVEPLFRRAGENRLSSDTLANLRNTLLPRLMSGKLRIPEIQEAVEEATA